MARSRVCGAPPGRCTAHGTTAAADCMDAPPRSRARSPLRGLMSLLLIRSPSNEGGGGRSWNASPGSPIGGASPAPAAVIFGTRPCRGIVGRRRPRRGTQPSCFRPPAFPAARAHVPFALRIHCAWATGFHRHSGPEPHGGRVRGARHDTAPRPTPKTPPERAPLRARMATIIGAVPEAGITFFLGVFWWG